MWGVLNVFSGDQNEREDYSYRSMSTPAFVASIDQGTSSSRCIVFDREGSVRSESQMEHQQFYPRPGCVEHDAEEIWVSGKNGTKPKEE